MMPVVIYTRDLCGYCSAAKALLSKKGITFEEKNASVTPGVRAEMIERSGRNTFPQIFIGAKHIGGSDDLHALDGAGELDQLLAGQ